MQAATMMDAADDQAEDFESPAPTPRSGSSSTRIPVASTAVRPAPSPGQSRSREIAALLATRDDGAGSPAAAAHTASAAASFGISDSSDAILAEAESLLQRHEHFMRARGGGGGSSNSSLNSPLARGGGGAAAVAAAALGTPPAAYSAASPIALVAVTSFHLREGPTLVCAVPALNSGGGGADGGGGGGGVPAALRAAAINLLPFKSLPENGLAATQLLGGGGGEDRCMFVLRAGGDVLFGASHFVRLQDETESRGFSQAAVVVLARVPYLGLLLQRLHAFSTEVLHTKDCQQQLARFHASLTRISFGELGYSLAFQELPVARLLLQLGGHVMSLLRLVLLEGRVLLRSRSGARASAAAFAIASLLPGCLALGLAPQGGSGGGGSSGGGSTADTPRPAAFEARAYRWRKYGFPLAVFRGTEVRFEPLLVMAEAAAVLRARGFLAGTTNAMIQSMPAAALDALVDLDRGVVSTAGTPRARAAFACGDDDRAFAQSLVGATAGAAAEEDGGGGGSGGGGSGAQEGAAWRGSGAWAADQFQLFFEELAARAAGALAREKAAARRRAEGVVDGSAAVLGNALVSWASSLSRRALPGAAPSPPSNGGAADPFAPLAWLNGGGGSGGGGGGAEAAAQRAVAGALEEYGRAWARAWVQTENFHTWCTSQAIPDEELLARPKHRRIVSAEAAAGDGSSNGGSSGGGARRGNRPPQSGHHSYTFPCGDSYVGGFQNGKREGTGLYTEHATGNTYEGDWHDGVRHGRGVLTSGGLDLVYDGEWDFRFPPLPLCALAHRSSSRRTRARARLAGKHCDADGNLYEGEYVRGVRHGAGRYTFVGARRASANALSSQLQLSLDPGAAAEGGSEQRRRHGSAGSAAPPPHGFVYVGEWRGGKQHGLGQCNYGDGRVYSGQWREGEWWGEGRLVLPDGGRYEGEFAAAKQHGLGMLTTATGDVLEGEWKWGLPVEGGEWRVRYANGDDYVGTVGLDAGGLVVPHGRGTYKYANGDVFTGEWGGARVRGEFVLGKRQGQGTCVFGNGEQFIGQWAGDAISLLGKGKLTLADGSAHEYT
ncbi:hypothetical protein JKP88DRAFT_262315 [Tribonema minus]|uniref:AVL9/DENND6 domain-containing protein n=1 Tax=Tribonema minus TaxID=303371 RepID=A0A835Z636_9STRA|nr:hypothetical protein JKP88DRAFT_262315 [Tribonema minus]